MGDKHVPWISHVRSTNLVAGIREDVAMSLMRMFTELAGKDYLKKQRVDPQFTEK